MSNNNYMTVPRFVSWRWIMGLGWVFFLAGGLLTALMIWSIPGEEDVIMLIVTCVMTLVFGGCTLAGLRMLLMPLDRIRISGQELRVTLFGVTMKRISTDSIHSVVGRIRDVRIGMRDRRIYTLHVNYDGKGVTEKTFLMERTAESDEAFQKYMPHVTLLL